MDGSDKPTGGGAAAAIPKTIPTQAERDDLLRYHVGELRKLSGAVEEARGPLSEAQQELTAAYNQAKADLGKGYSRKILAKYVEDIQARIRDQVAEENQRAHDRAVLALPVFGKQQDLFPETEVPQETRDETQWAAEGYRLGLIGGARALPENCPARFLQVVLRGYDAGQVEAGRVWVAGQEAMKRRDTPDAGKAAVDLNGSTETVVEPDSHAVKAAERKSIAKAKESLAQIGTKAAPAAEQQVAA